jgi:N-acetylneuraminic acid mutarotase
MRKVHVWLLGGSLIMTAMIISQGCTKSTDSDDLIGNWKAASDFDGIARSEAVSFVIGDYAYIATGTTERDRLKDLWEFSLTKQYWTQKADLPGVVRNSAVAFSIGNKGYLGVGIDGSTFLNDFWEYDPIANSWTEKAHFGGSARRDAVAFVLNGKGYISCGYDGNFLKDLWEYTPGATPADMGSWTQKASLTGSKRLGAASFVINNIAYIVSGNNNGTMLNDLYAYDPVANQWTEKRKIYDYSEDSYDDDYTGIGRQNGVAFVMNNLAYLTTGENSSQTSSTWEYDPSTDAWLEKTGFEGTGRSGAISFTLANRGFVLTGRSGSLIMDNGFEFHPGDEVVDGD